MALVADKDKAPESKALAEEVRKRQSVVAGLSVKKFDSNHTEHDQMAAIEELHEHEQKGGDSPLHHRFHLILSSSKFDGAMGIVILLNTFCIGVQSHYNIQGQATPLANFVEYIFMLIYTVELIARFYTYKADAIKSFWVRMDLFVVITGWFTLLVYDPGASGDLPPIFGLFPVIRMVRLARLTPLVAQFRSFSKLIFGLKGSFNTIAAAVTMLLLVLFVCSVLVVELITKEAVRVKDEEPEFFNAVNLTFPPTGLYDVLLRLTSFVTVDGVSAIVMLGLYRPFTANALFIPTLLVISISLMNLVTAVIVEGSFEASRMDREVEKTLKKNKIRKMIPKLTQLFNDLDNDSSGKITLSEVLDSPDEVLHTLEQVIPIDDLQEVFDLLDDGDGSVESKEFLLGIEKMAVTDLPLEQFRMMKQISLNRRETAAVRETIWTIESHINQHFMVIEKHLNKVDRHLETVEAGVGAVDMSTLPPHQAYNARPKFPPRV
jgi:voltage-gated sodium channel